MTNAFNTDSGLLTVDRVEQIDKAQFAGRRDIKRLIIAEGIKHIPEDAFYECTALESVELPNSLESIEPAAFGNCSGLSHIKLPTALRRIDCLAFVDCIGLKELLLPDGLEYIGTMAFQGSGLRRISVPSSVGIIGEEAFFSCHSLEHADVLGVDTLIEENALEDTPLLCTGYIAPGYPTLTDRAAELLYTLLWCSCPERHSEDTCTRAESFIRHNEELVMEWIFKRNNLAAMTTLCMRSLLSDEHMDVYIRQSLSNKQTEITALLLKARAGQNNHDEDFEL